ncbi:monovalent cation/H+ antiporter subunit D [Pontibaca methylaminivorans]|uniref:monovalent cation/H+ antiporter subunit D n=1 Tax=Pontibaca methylaminivorans TaxID=515897 RepID=UPI002FDA427A
MSHWIILPIILPAMIAAFILLVLRGEVMLQRVFSIAGTVALVGIAGVLLAQAMDGTITVYELSAWPAPFGIVLVLDRLSALMVMLTALLSLVVVIYSIGTAWDRRGRNFHALFHFQLMGIMGAFLTGDAFNLFVFFEVLLIASYGLMVHGGGAVRLRAGVQYVVYNLLASALFLIALGTLYAVTGTLNMADMAARVSQVPLSEAALLRVGAILLLAVFAVKAALLPLHFWLPASYGNAPGPVGALFAIMTKVGAYCILRMFTLVFGPDQIATVDVQGWLLPGALLTLAIGMIGLLGTRLLSRLASFAVIASMGTLLIAVSLFTQQSSAAALYYIAHSTFATGLMFLIVDLAATRRGDAIGVSAPMPQGGLIAALFFGGAITLVGMPPFSGFLGKMLVLDAARHVEWAGLIWAVILSTSLIGIVGFTRAGSLVFWKGHDPGIRTEPPDEADLPAPLEAEAAGGPVRASSAMAFGAVWGLFGLVILLTLFAGPMQDYAEATAAQLHAPGDYIRAVLGESTR